MQILPVLDLLGGVVVRGVAGQRSVYKPIISRLTPRTDALSVAQALRDEFDLATFYVADLDAIMHGSPNWGIYHALAERGFEILIDAGVKATDTAARLLDAGCAVVIAGLESCPQPELLTSLCETCGSDRVIFSLDLQGGRPLGDLTGWRVTEPAAIAASAIAAGIQRMIVLDLAQVGVGGGLSTTGLCRRILADFPHSRLITGGGIRDIQDLLDAESCGIDGMLIASALHDGRLRREDVKRFRA